MTPARRVWSTISGTFTGVPTDAAEPSRPVPPPPAAAAAAAAPGEDGPTVGFPTRLSTEISRHPVRLVVACLASVLGPAVVAQAGSVGVPPDATAEVAGTTAVAKAALPVPVPGDAATWEAVAQSAARTCPGLPPGVLVAIGRVESNLGLQAALSPAGARGPMQFLPGTWAAYGADGDGDGGADVTNATDALFGAARLLCANGGGDTSRLPSALWNYNHSRAYVERVMALADLR